MKFNRAHSEVCFNRIVEALGRTDEGRARIETRSEARRQIERLERSEEEEQPREASNEVPDVPIPLPAKGGCRKTSRDHQYAFIKKYADRQVKRGVDGKSGTAGGRSVWLCSEDLSSTPVWQYRRLGPALFLG